jgi:enterochelin esterase-like enzyme
MMGMALQHLRRWAVLLSVCVMTAMLAAPSHPAAAGQVLPFTLASPVLGRSWVNRIYLPDGYGDGATYPVIYLLHGANNDAAGWVDQADINTLVDRLIRGGRLRPCIIVMPSVENSWYLDGPERMETALIQDLLPWVEAHYAIRADRAARTVAGISMGGFGALRLALDHPQLFSAVALLSPAIYVPEPPAQSAARRAAVFQTNGVFDPARWKALNYPALIDGFAATHLRLRLFISAGAQDGLHTNIAGRTLYDIWRARGWQAEMHVSPGQHDFKLWRHDLPPALRFLLPQPTETATTSR